MASRIISSPLSAIGRLILSGGAGSGRARGLLAIWLIVQKFTDLYYRVRPVRAGCIFKYSLRLHKGEPIRLADGSRVNAGDLVLELHLNNAGIARRLAEPDGNAPRSNWIWSVLHDAMTDLRVMAGPDFEPKCFAALHGVSLLGSTARRLGFEEHPLSPSWYHDLVRFFMMGLLSIYSPAGSRRLATVDQATYPAEFWFGRMSLLERYGGARKRPTKDPTVNAPC